MSLSNLTPAQLRKAASIVEKIEKLQDQLNGIYGGGAAPVGRPPGRKRRKISAAGIARIREAQRKRWAKVHASKGKGK